MLAKFQNRISATRFEFSVHVHSLQPWPAGNKAIAIGWQRGKRRRGVTKSVLPLPTQDKMGTVVRFNERFNLMSSLYKVPGAGKKELGPFKNKALILAVLETDGRTNATAALGRVVINLAEFANIDGQEVRTFPVACNKSIHAAVGEPQLTLTIRSRWNKAGADMTEDEVASMSTDQSGSSLTNNLKDFFSRVTSSGRKGAGSKDREQDLDGFRGATGGGAAMDTIGEDEEGDENGGRRHTDEAEFGPPESVEFETPRGSQDLGPYATEHLEYDVAGALNMHDDEDDYYPGHQQQQHASSSSYPAGGGRGGAPPQQQQKGLQLPGGQQQQQQQVSTTPVPGTPGSAGTRRPSTSGGGGGRFRMETVGGTAGAAVAPAQQQQQSGPRISAQRQSTTQTESYDLLPGDHLDPGGAMSDELLVAGAQEFALYNAQRSLRPGRSAARAIHAPARRIARTLVCLGRQDGLPFGALMLRQVKATVLSGRADTQLLAFWWTNTCHLRGFLQSLNLAVAGKTAPGQPQALHWAAAALVPKLLQQEKFIFDEMVSHMWTHTLVPRVAASRARPPSVVGGANKRAAHEAALRKWTEALDHVNATLKGLGRGGHVATLRHQVLLDLLKRMDILLFHYLLSTPEGSLADSFSEAGSEADGPNSAAPLMDPRNPNMPVLDDSMMFFSRGALTFNTGMNLKMACTRFQQWAFGEGELKEIWSALPAQGQSLFPLLRGASDLLMMPKDLLLDASVREEMTAALPLQGVVYMAGRFQADDFAQEGMPGDVLSELRAEAVGLGLDPHSAPVLEVEAECAYYSPTDDMVMEVVEVGDEPGLEYDGDSEDELDQLSALHCDDELGVGPPLRFKLLHNLWSQGVPRNRAVTLGRKGSGGGGADSHRLT